MKKTSKKMVKANDQKETAIGMSDIFKRGILINFRAGRWGATAGMSSENLTAEDNEKEVIRAVQSLITPEDRELLSEIKSDINDCKRFIYLNSIPFPLEALSFVPKDRIIKVNDFLLGKKQEIKEKTEIFLEKYGKVKADYKRRYPKLYREDKYPSKERLRNRFYIFWAFHRLEIPEGGKDSLITPEIYKQEVKKFQETINEMTSMATKMIGKSFINRINSLKEQAENGEINMRTVNAVRKVLNRFETLFKDFVNEEEILNAVKECKKFLIKEDPEVMREDSKWLEKLSKSMGEVVSQLETLPDVEIKKRRIKID